MGSWRDQKREARRILHKTMEIESLYYVDGLEPINLPIRLHVKFDAIGDDRSMGWAEMQVERPRIVFLSDYGVSPKNGAVVYIQPGEAYQIDSVLPNHDITVTAEVTRMTKRQMERHNPPLPLEL